MHASRTADQSGGETGVVTQVGAGVDDAHARLQESGDERGLVRFPDAVGGEMVGDELAGGMEGEGERRHAGDGDPGVAALGRHESFGKPSTISTRRG